MLARRPGCLEFSQRQVEMEWRESVHFTHARSRVMLIEPGATMAGAVKCIRLAEGAAASGMAGRSMKPQEA